MPRYILGLNKYDHDVSAVLLADGVPVVGICKERITREKYAGGAADVAVGYCLKTAGRAPRRHRAHRAEQLRAPRARDGARPPLATALAPSSVRRARVHAEVAALHEPARGDDLAPSRARLQRVRAVAVRRRRGDGRRRHRQPPPRRHREPARGRHGPSVRPRVGVVLRVPRPRDRVRRSKSWLAVTAGVLSATTSRSCRDSAPSTRASRSTSSATGTSAAR